MNITTQTQKLQLILKKHELLTLKNSQPKMAIECKDGVIWVTRAGEHQDHILRAGRHYVPGSKGSLVIEAIDDACVDIEEKQ